MIGVVKEVAWVRGGRRGARLQAEVILGNHSICSDLNIYNIHIENLYHHNEVSGNVYKPVPGTVY